MRKFLLLGVLVICIALIVFAMIHLETASEPLLKQQELNHCPIGNPHYVPKRICTNTSSTVTRITAHAINWGIQTEVTYANEGPVPFHVEIFSDGSFQNVDASTAHCKLALLVEPPVISPAMYRDFKDPRVHQQFDAVFTFNDELLSMGKPFHLSLFGSCTVLFASERVIWPQNLSAALFDASRIIAGKKAGISEIFSSKAYAPGHQLRHEIWAKFSNRLLGFGSGLNVPLPSKRVALEPYRFSVVIENGIDQDWYFSEKLIDSLAMLTVPIYWSRGNPRLSHFFNTSGFIMFSSLEDLSSILDGELATEELQAQAYSSRMNAILCNFQRAIWFLDIYTYRNLNHQIVDPADGTLRPGICC